MRTLVLVHGALASLALLIAVPPAIGMQSAPAQQQLKIASGTWWGSVGDRVEVEFKDQLSTRKFIGTITKLDLAKGIVTLQGEIDGRQSTRPMFASTILSMKTLGADGNQPAGTTAAPAGGSATAAAPSTPGAKPTGSGITPSRAGPSMELASGRPSGKVDAQGFALDDKGFRISPKRGVFVLPWKDGVGQTARHDEIEQVAKEADKWGPGQIIVMEIDSPGGLVTEIYKISETLREVRKRHRVVAWVKEAISAAAVTSLHCDEIYFRRSGALGAAMMIRGEDGVHGPMLEMFKEEMGRVATENGRPREVLLAMIQAEAVLTYTKDPITGKPTFHDHITGLPGEVVLSDDKDNLVFNASNALDSGFSNGTADTPEELAPLLGLPEWYEVSDYGRKLAKAWQTLYKDCDEDIAYQMQRWNIKRAGGTIEQINIQIQIGEKILQWAKRCPPCVNGKLDPDAVAKEVERLRKQLVELRKRGA